MDTTRWSFAAAGLGAAAWLVTPELTIGAPPAFGSIEHVFLFLPLVAVPPALVLVTAFLESAGILTRLHQVAQRAQPVASAMVLASFLLPKGNMAGVLAAGWMLFAAAIAVAGVRAVGPKKHLNLFAAHLLVFGGSVWLLLSRLVLIALLGAHLGEASPAIRRVHRAAAIGSLAGIPLIFAGTISGLLAVKFAGVALIVLSTIAVAIISIAVALRMRSVVARSLLCVSGASMLLAMIAAGIFGAGEAAGREWISIPQMVQTHGLLNALGFVLCGLAAHVSLLREARGSVDHAHAGRVANH